MPPKPRPPFERMMEKVDTKGPRSRNGLSRCWIFKGATSMEGYGRVRAAEVTLLAHRVAWEEANGSIPNGMCVCHACDVKTCVNPDHLFLGTRTDNNKDRHDKGRTKIVRGEKQGLAKLTAAKVRKMRQDVADGRTTISKRAMELGVTPQAAWCAVRRLTWKHVK